MTDRSLHFPFEIGRLGRPRTSDTRAAIREQLEQLLFTIPGERVNRPNFGCAVQRLVFGSADRETAAAVEHVIRTNVRDYLGELIDLDALRVTASDATLTIDILYTVRATRTEHAETFVRPIEGAA